MATAVADPLRVRMTGYARINPHPAQHAFLSLNCREALYGGATGGGKSAALLAAALQYVDVPGYAALIVRKTFAQMHKSDSILTQAKEWLAETDAVWRASENAFFFPSGARLEFGHMQNSDARFNYQGGAFHFVGFDELTQFEEQDYLYLFSRQRKHAEGTISGVPLRMRSASNPGGLGHEWVRSRFVLREPQPDGKGPPPPGDRMFIPAKLEDNPSIDAESYHEALAELDARTRQMYLDGRWDVREQGACFTEFEFEKHTVEGTRKLRSPYPVVRALDWGFHHMPVLWLEVQGRQVVVFDEWHGQNATVPIAAAAMREIDREHGLKTAETDTFVDPAGLGTSYQTGESDVDMLRAEGFSIIGEDERFGRETRTGLIKIMLDKDQLFISRDRCPYLVKCLERAVWDRHGIDGAPKDAYKKDGKWDHHLDALGEALVRLFPPEGRPAANDTPVVPAGPWTPGYYSESEFG